MGSRWTLIDPAGNAFFILGVEDVIPDTSNNQMGVSYRTTIAAKYGDTGAPNWGPSQVERLRAWAFNTIGPFNSPYVWANDEESVWPGDHYNPQKMPFFNSCLRPGYYSMINSPAYISEPVKNFVFALNTKYDTYYVPSGGEPDYYDPKLYEYLDGILNYDWQMQALNNPNNPYNNWLIGVVGEEADQTYSFNAGADFPTYPETGHNHAHGGYRAAVCSPIQTANYYKAAVYSDTTVYTKLAWRDYLQSLPQYQTSGKPDISKLNAAWGSNYTTWDSSGKAIKGVSLGTGTGSRRSFDITLPSTPISVYSLQVLISGVPVGGDFGNGMLWGPNPSGGGLFNGTVNYNTGAVSVTFASGHVPARNAPVTINYVAGGWGIGTGLLDEDGRNTAWMGTDSTYMTGANPKFLENADGFLYEMAKHFFEISKSHTLSHFNAIVPGWKPLYFGIDVLFYWDTPSRPPVLKAASEEFDAFIVNGYPLPQPQLDYLYKYAGDKPLINFELYTANPDSAMWRYPGMNQMYSTQADRSVGYRETLLATSSPPGLISATYTATKTNPYIGSLWWQYLDMARQEANWGLVTLSDNAYDGHEAVQTDSNYSRTIPCSPPLDKYLCGGEEKNYGNFAGRAEYANQTALQAFCQSLGGCQ